MELRILGAHQWESNSHRCACALIDGTIAIDAGSICSALSLDEQAAVRAVLLTHYHLDHVKDFGSLAFHTFDHRTLTVFSSALVRRTVTKAIVDTDIWLDLERFPSPEAPAVRYIEVGAFESVAFDGYTIRGVPVAHAVPCTGFEVTDAAGKRLFYTSDTGPDWVARWNEDSPRLDVLVTEVTFSNRMADLAKRAAHQTPAMLQLALEQFREQCGYLPRVVVTHLQPPHEEAIREEVAIVNRNLAADITVATEDQRFEV